MIEDLKEKQILLENLLSQVSSCMTFRTYILGHLIGSRFLCFYNNNNINEMKVFVENREFTIIVEEEPEGRGFSGQCKELPTAISQGKTLEELEENIKDAIQSVLDIQEDRF